MESMLARLGPLSHAALRIVFGLLLACHGAQKLFGMFGGFAMSPTGKVEVASLLGAAAIIELIGGLLVALGVRARLAAFICSGEMAAAYFMAHQPQGLLPIENKGELAVLYCFGFFLLACLGPGPFTLERGGR
jgi:putative oxidoreductase